MPHSQIIAHRLLQRRFEQHRARLERHKDKGPAFRAAVEDLEKRLFKEVSCPENQSADTSSTGQ